jgi:hypothetical protein
VVVVVRLYPVACVSVSTYITPVVVATHCHEGTLVITVNCEPHLATAAAYSYRLQLFEHPIPLRLGWLDSGFGTPSSPIGVCVLCAHLFVR